MITTIVTVLVGAAVVVGICAALVEGFNAIYWAYKKPKD
jgi:hypothetical protein